MSIEQAANLLSNKLQGLDWLVGIGHSKDVIILMVTRLNDPKAESLKRDGWEGFQVKIHKTGRVSPAGSPS